MKVSFWPIVDINSIFRNMIKNPVVHDVLWMLSELCYYLGLVSSVILLPLVTIVLWLMELADVIELDFWYMLIGWLISVLVLLVGVIIKRYCFYTNKES